MNQVQTQARGRSHKENKQNNLVRIRTLTVSNMVDDDIAALLVAWLTLYILRRRRKTRLTMRARLRDIIFGERNKEVITILCIHLAKLSHHSMLLKCGENLSQNRVHTSSRKRGDSSTLQILPKFFSVTGEFPFSWLRHFQESYDVTSGNSMTSLPVSWRHFR